MKKIDFAQIDGHLLQTFLAILEESSVSAAADRIGITQSAVSHKLAKLRNILGDPLFVRSGQGLTPTETALSLKTPVQDVLDRLHALTDLRRFDPLSEAMHFVIAANDMPRDLIFPHLSRNALRDGIDVSLDLIPSGIPSVRLLRDARCDLMVTPLPPDAPDLIQHKLFSGRMMCFYDPTMTDPPRTVEDYLAADHVAAVFPGGGAINHVVKAPALPYVPKPKIAVSNFAGIPPFILGTNFLSTQIEFMHQTSLYGLAMAPLPFASAPVGIFMVWHERSTNDPAHKWLRDTVKQIGADQTAD